MPNRLAQEDSLYLRQHAENPVDWYPWGDEAFKKARDEDKPVLVSIGYSACHWCHVMAHESFEDASIAKLMNTHFICIKVDREERPDIDQIYMDAVQMLNGHGGWPLNAFCLPDGRPFAGGTYFPPDERRGHNIVPWPQLLMRVADFYDRQRKDLVQNAEAIIGNLEASNSPHQATGDPVGPDEFLQAVGRLLDNHDAEFGGFGTAPKFPPAMTLEFLLAMRASATIELGNPEIAGGVDQAINRTLTGMAHGGLFDQIGGGFARYSVDQHWLIPHFEKMLYDNALLLDIYSKAWQRYPKPLYKKVVEETVGWLEREMRSPEGAYYAALDADTEGEEGKTYLWYPAEVKSILGDEAGARFCEAYGITTEGNFEETGLSNPALLEGDADMRDTLESDRKKLLQVRNARPQPGRDNKCLTAWNALLVRGLAQAAFTFGRKDWMEAAIRLGEWIWSHMRDENGRLLSVSYNGTARGNGNLDDYAHTAQAYMVLAAYAEWISPGASKTWRERAEELVGIVSRHFGDPSAVGYYFTSDDHESLVHRKKDWFDNATPSGNASMAQAFSSLEAVTGEAAFGEQVERLKVAYPGIVQTSPAAASHALSAFVQRAVGIAVIKVRQDADLEALHKALTGRPWRQVFISVEEGDELPAAYQLCAGTQCLPPTNSAEELAGHL
ncbi:thioredoxin domain-containing protein [Puniceicoccales bacterium CK1056]|uniref:Thioredoxin domain-containing protein n=1 Tax=Oceanipulchritudo coccoides TaxID=2706888 RepID=A0A6B2M1Q8_9BACT|nr:thioredoxin domain-containing protein [Oceanipulchritudo coccoides]NDV62282.1 thioredoxin domain-containing protein [Oceanipulchritudo coccoides]